MKQGPNLKIFLIRIMAAKAKDEVEHVISPAKDIPTSIVMIRDAHC